MKSINMEGNNKFQDIDSGLTYYIHHQKINNNKIQIKPDKEDEYLKKKNIMIVDDEYEIVEMLKIMLESSGFDTIECFSGTDCLEKLNIEKPDLYYWI